MKFTFHQNEKKHLFQPDKNESEKVLGWKKTAIFSFGSENENKLSSQYLNWINSICKTDESINNLTKITIICLNWLQSEILWF